MTMHFLQTRVFGVRLIVITLSTYWTAMFLGTHISIPPSIAQGVGDKYLHFGGYFGLAVLLYFALLDWPLTRRLLLTCVVVAIYGALDESTQALVPGRFADVRDYVADLCGMMTGLTLCWIYSCWIGTRENQGQAGSSV
jgi:VanZ family protein